ncbi:MAG: 3-deoxy-8-phosphooctulonate synthase [Acidobacteria bacterium]|jgi:2-dehydro-3-deoxyphosphooctonate aldolase (KDO 8-P synthase)|nr:3-deoxy-8-phosphooctulonate synthase [Acidobacteriota bacterium]
MPSYFKIDNLEIGNDGLFFILGPCVIENENFTIELARQIKEITAEAGVPFIFKASFDKANRTSVKSFRGPGLKEGLRILKRVKEELAIPVLSDIHEPWQAEAAAGFLSVIQIPAFLSRQTDLLIAAGNTGLAVNLKKSQYMAPEDMALAVEKVISTGNTRIMLTERGTFFGYRNLVVDFRSIPIMKQNGFPVILDVTHSVQRPSAADGITGGNPEFVPILAASGVVSGADGIFMEVHPNPAAALSDGSNSLHIKNLKTLLIRLKKLYNISS